jgi:hypothetical protein
MLFPPFWARPAHIVVLGPIMIEERSHFYSLILNTTL